MTEIVTRMHLAEDNQLTVIGCLHDPANVQQTSSKCNAGRMLDSVNTLLLTRIENITALKLAQYLFAKSVTYTVETKSNSPVVAREDVL